MKILITAGPTREPIDPVRFLSNRSSGKMGYALADAARIAGHDVRLISGPVTLSAPDGVALVQIQTAAELYDAVHEAFPWCDACVMAAAVADWTPAQVHPQKVKKGDERWMLDLKPTQDVLTSLIPLKGHRVVVGFAAETERIEENALRKLAEKQLDMIVANDVSKLDSGFAVDTNRATLYVTREAPRVLPTMLKSELATYIMQEVERLLTPG